MSKKKSLRLKVQDTPLVSKVDYRTEIKPAVKQAPLVMDPFSIFTLFHKGNYKRPWFVWRDKETCEKLTEIRGGQSAPKGTLRGATKEQLAFARANSLLQKLEMHGPILTGHWDKKTKVDSVHGQITRKDRLVKKPEYQMYANTAERYNRTLNRDKNEIIPCVSQGLYHTHFSDGKNSRVMMWLAFPDTRLIVIVDLGHHRNFNYKPHIDPVTLMFQAMEAALDQGFYGPKAKKYSKDIELEQDDAPYMGPASSDGRIA